MMDIENLYDKFEEKLKSSEAEEYWRRFVVADSEVLKDNPQMRPEIRAALALQLMEVQ